MNLFGKIGTRPWRNLRLALWGLVALFAIVMLGFVLPSLQPGRIDPPEPRVKAELRSIAAACDWYFLDYAVYPQGTTEEVFRLLTGHNVNGRNPRKVVYLHWTTGRGFVDFWGKSYQLDFTEPARVRVASAGRNGKFGDEDDLEWTQERMAQ